MANIQLPLENFDAKEFVPESQSFRTPKDMRDLDWRKLRGLWNHIVSMQETNLRSIDFDKALEQIAQLSNMTLDEVKAIFADVIKDVESEIDARNYYKWRMLSKYIDKTHTQADLEA